uniref:Fas apoptotic inhibitory molecule n=1 Tax=Fundulus heteroclitus TaxID=8078 RepID=A0A3Q2QWN8_FUNHE
MLLLLRRHVPVPSASSEPEPAAPGAPRSVLGSRMLGGDAVAVWEVALSDGVYTVEFAHGTTTGKRVVCVNGTEVLRKDWMFKLVGKETFAVGGAGTKATISIEAVGGFAYEYSLSVDGKSLQSFTDNRARTTKTWTVQVDGTAYRIVLEKDTMDVWCNGQRMDTRVRTGNLDPVLRVSTRGPWAVYGPWTGYLRPHNAILAPAAPVLS